MKERPGDSSLDVLGADRLERTVEILRRRVIALQDSVEVLTNEVSRLRSENSERHADISTALDSLPDWIDRKVVWGLKNAAALIARLVAERQEISEEELESETTRVTTQKFFPPEMTPVDTW